MAKRSAGCSYSNAPFPPSPRLFRLLRTSVYLRQKRKLSDCSFKTKAMRSQSEIEAYPGTAAINQPVESDATNISFETQLGMLPERRLETAAERR